MITENKIKIIFFRFLHQRDKSKWKTDKDVILENMKFIWNEDEMPATWEEKLAKKYYDKLFREYCICDLSRFKENKIANRFRIEKEIVNGKGQFICGETSCKEEDGLRTWEVNFAYVEGGERKNALVKIRKFKSEEFSQILIKNFFLLFRIMRSMFREAQPSFDKAGDKKT